ncbi:MAG: ribose 5-phosphate isomerase B [Candidatus Omnitrophica bacterium]|nr:ribose 5-phosphate isomerase B [Candidatus Omnitrophota bacterium]
MKHKIFIAADHRGVVLKKKIVGLLSELGYSVEDLGSYDENCPCDYPKYSFLLGEKVARTKNSRGILVCMTGIGHSIAANKIKGVYAALCYNKEAAILSRQHNNANVLVLGAKFVAKSRIFDIINSWLSAEFEGGRHLRRTNQIKAMEKKIYKVVRK